jgi:hypothetical protein
MGVIILAGGFDLLLLVEACATIMIMSASLGLLVEKIHALTDRSGTWQARRMQCPSPGEFLMRQPVGYPIGSHRGFRTTKTPK